MYKVGDLCCVLLDKVQASNHIYEGKNTKQTGLLWSTVIGVDFTGNAFCLDQSSKSGHANVIILTLWCKKWSLMSLAKAVEMASNRLRFDARHNSDTCCLLTTKS